MGLEDFNSSEEKDEDDESYLEVSDCMLESPCECDISEIHSFEVLPDELDVVAHLRGKHSKKFEEAVKQVRRIKRVKS